MIKIDELMSGIMRYGRGNMQDLVARTKSTGDVISYIQAERYLEFTNLISYVTTNMIDFKKKDDFVATPGQESQPDRAGGDPPEKILPSFEERVSS